MNMLSCKFQAPFHSNTRHLEGAWCLGVGGAWGLKMLQVEHRVHRERLPYIAFFRIFNYIAE